MEEGVFAVWKGVWYDTTGSALGGGIGKRVEREVESKAFSVHRHYYLFLRGILVLGEKMNVWEGL